MTARAEVVSLFLAQHGVTLPARRVLELARGRLDRRAVEQVLRRAGVPVRGVEASRDVLSTLPLPLLLELRGEQLCVLERLSDDTALLRDADQRVRRAPLRELASELECAFESLPSASSTRFARLLMAGVLGRARDLTLLGVTVLALAALGLLTPWLTRLAIGEALHERSHSLLGALVVSLFAASALRAGLSWLRARARIALEAQVLRRAVPSVFKRILSLSFAAQEQTGLSEQLASLSSAELAARCVTTLSVGPVIELITLLVYLVALAVASPTIAGVCAAAAVVTGAVAYFIAALRARSESEAVREAAVTRARLHDLLQGIATVKAEHAERRVMVRWLDALLRERGLCLTRDMRDGALELWLLFSQRAQRLFVLCYCARELLDQRMTLAELIYLGMLSEGLSFALETATRLLGVSLSLRLHTERVDATLAQASEPPSGPGGAREPSAGRPAIHMSDVWFRHGPDQPWILEGYNLSVREGEHLTLRGASGSGKTTILRLLAGIYRPERGTVSVHGRDPARDRSGICYLPQQAQLFAGSLRDNLEQLSAAPLARIQVAAERTALASFLGSLPMGIETVVAAQGANLSGGQRQWVLVTAAVASERPVVLLDEPFAQLDHLVRSRLCVEQLFESRTTVTVAHD